MTALQVEGLSHGFGSRWALEDVAFAVAPASFTVLLGPNGSGKTTLVSLATGLYAARTGSVSIFGHDIRREPLRALAELGVVFQTPTLDLELSVAENLAYCGALRGFSRHQAAARGLDELRRLDAADRASDKARTLSGGMRRRVEIACALIHEPRLLIMDEPTSGLDLASRRGLVSYVRSLCRMRGLAVLWATHMLDEVEPRDPLVVLHEGRVRWAGDAGGFAGTGGLAETFLRLTGEPA